ncbi:MAG: mucin desulfatase, partial [Candidatus Aminicenantales bacterium]
MELKPLPELDTICAAFDCSGTWISSCPIPSGHINDTYCSEFDESRRRVKYVNQRINHLVFREPELLMENIERVTRFARERIVAAGGDPERETLTIVPTRDGKSFHRTPEGTYWRMFKYIDGARTYDRVEDIRHVYAASKAFGRFQKMLASLPGGRLHETIPDFHHTRKRYDAFLAAVEFDPSGRAAGVKPEIDFVLAREKDA